jgi:hypothetical protein
VSDSGSDEHVEEADETAIQARGVSRRDLIKKGAIGTGAAVGIAWAAPKIEGLSLQPAYAAALSVPPTTTTTTTLLPPPPPCTSGDFTFNIALPGTTAGPASAGGDARASAGCADIVLHTSSHYDSTVPGDNVYDTGDIAQEIDASGRYRHPRFYQTISIDKASGGANCTINAVTFDVPAAPGHGKGIADEDGRGGMNGPCSGPGCSDNGEANSVYGAYLVDHRDSVTSPPLGHINPYTYDAPTGYTLTANGVYALFSSDPDQSNDLGRPSGGGVAHVKVSCT